MKTLCPCGRPAIFRCVQPCCKGDPNPEPHCWTCFSRWRELAEFDGHPDEEDWIEAENDPR